MARHGSELPQHGPIAAESRERIVTENQQQSELIMRKFGPVSDGESSGEEDAASTGEGSVSAQDDTPSQRELIGRQLSVVTDRMRSNHKGWLAHFGYSYAEGRFRDLRENAKELQKEFSRLPHDSDEVLEFQTKVDDLEAAYNRLRFRLVFLPTCFVVGFGILALGLLFDYSGFLGWIQDKLEVKRLMRYVVLALAGAAVYMSTSAISEMSSESDSKRQGFSVGIVVFRFGVALVMAIILVMLTFKKAGAPLKFGQMWKSPEMWSFICGYSANLIILMANKVVEKVSNMIKSL